MCNCVKNLIKESNKNIVMPTQTISSDKINKSQSFSIRKKSTETSVVITSPLGANSSLKAQIQSSNSNNSSLSKEDLETTSSITTTSSSTNIKGSNLIVDTVYQSPASGELRSAARRASIKLQQEQLSQMLVRIFFSNYR
jgi:hypothetical protein